MANPKTGKDLLQEWERFVENKDAQAFHELYIGYYHYFHFRGLKRGFPTSTIEDAVSDIFCMSGKIRKNSVMSKTTTTGPSCT